MVPNAKAKPHKCHNALVTGINQFDRSYVEQPFILSD